MDYKYILEHMTLFDKASMLVGYRNMKTRPMEAFDIPSLIMSDGPNGVRKENDGDISIDNSVRTLPATCFPAGNTLSNSWDDDLLYKVGEQIALECHYYGINAILGPAVNIKRNPLCGRNFEYLSEDPVLSGYLASKFIKGVQDNHVLSCIKHYAANNLEKWRYIGDSIVDLRALNDIYLKSFEIAIRESNPGMVMTAYNQINGTFASENVYLIRNRLRNKFGYDGLTVTDWGGMVHRDIALNAGQDLEMPGMVKENIKSIVDGVNNKLIDKKTVDESLLRLLKAIDATRVEKLEDESVFEKGEEIALKSAIEGAVLLKNKNGILPLSKDKKYVVIGDLFQNMRFQGSGSALINAKTLFDNKKAFDEMGIEYEYQPGYNQMNPEINLILETDALNAAKEADTIIFFGGLTDLSESEGFDREDMKLDVNQEHLIERLVSLNKKIVFIMYGGAPFEIPCEDKIDGLLYMSLPGECGGLALTKLLFGEISPSGKLSQTWPKRYEDIPYSNEFDKTPYELYKESIFVGYRYYNTVKKEVMFPFGYGLTYGKYSFSNLKAKLNGDYIDINFKVTNESDISLSSIAQIYVSKPESGVYRAKKELKAYARVDLSPKEEKEVSARIKLVDLKIYDSKTGEDKLEDGEYIIYLSENVEKDIESTSIKLVGETLTSLPRENIYLSPTNINNIDKAQFEVVIDRKIKDYEPSKRPYTLETPICEYKSFFGKIIRNQMMKMGDKVIKDAKKIKDEKEKQRQIKSGTFIKKMMVVNCMRSLCFSSAGMLSYLKAQGLIDLANGKIFRAIRKLTK